MTFRVLTEAEVAEREAASAEYWAAEGVRQRQIKACSGHEWEMELYDPEDDVGIALRCLHCPAEMDDVFTDGQEFIYCEIDAAGGVVTVNAGRHDSPVALVVPVNVRVEGIKRWTDYGWEYDAELDVTQRGRVRSPGGVP